jgi:UDP-glucose 4-epimerase
VGELYAQVFGRAYDLENVSMRYFNVFGPRQDPSSQYSGVLARFLAAHRDGAVLVIYGDGEQSRDFIYVGNIADITLRAAEAPGVSGMVFNAGTGHRYTLNETVKLLERISGRPPMVRHDPARAGDILHSQADVTLARKHLGYEPRISYEEGLRLTWEWYKSNPSR